MLSVFKMCAVLLMITWPALNPVLAQANLEAPPNIVFILADDLGYADTGATGARTIRTPHIDSLAAQGLLLTNGYASSAICSPTRTALLTGHYPQRYRVGLDEPLRSSDAKKYDLGLPKGVPTMATYFREAGYETVLIGKWHQGLPPDHSALEHGYEYFFGVVQGAADYFLHTMVKDGKSTSLGLMQGDQEISRPGYMTDILGDEAVRVVRERSGRPLFLSLHFTAPHWPWEGRGDESVARTLGETQHYDGGSLQTYGEMVEAMDDNIGKVLDALQTAGMTSRTLVVFTSDNGGERFSDNWPFVGVKAELLEGGIRVPVMIRWPGRIQPGTVSNQVMSSMDFLPTLAAAAGIDRAENEWDGINLLPHWLGKKDPIERTLFWRFKANEQAAMRQGSWKYLRLGGKEHLFRLDHDPRERAGLAEKFPQQLEAMRRRFQQWDSKMLPYPEESFSESTKRSYADRF